MPITVITSGNNTDGAATTTFAQAIGSSAAGDLLYFSIRSAASISSFSDTQNNVWVQLRADLDSNSTTTLYIYYCLSAKGGGANTVNVTFGASQQCARFWLEASAGYGFTWSTDTTGNFAKSAVAGTALNSGNITTIGTNDILISSALASGGTFSAGSGWTDIQDGAFGDHLMRQIVTTAGTYAATGTQVSGNWAINIAAFKALSSGLASSKVGYSPVYKWIGIY